MNLEESKIVENICPNCFRSLTSIICEHCSYNISETKKASYALKEGTILNNNYIIGRVLGVGGFGITYLAKNISNQVNQAIKEYFPSELVLRNSGSNYLQVSINNKHLYAKGLDRFYKEISILSSLSDCKGIVAVSDYFKENNSAYMVMELLDGLTVRRFISSNNGSLSYKKSYEILIEVSRTLKRVHSKGLLHRDISPENIFITNSGEIKLIDFGAARYFVGAKSSGLSVILKPGFAPPEQYSSKSNQGPWTDIYALASTFYFTLTGRMIPEALERLSGKKIESISSIVPQVPEHIAKAINKALNLNLQDRYMNMFEFMGEIVDDNGVTYLPPLEKTESKIDILEVVCAFFSSILKKAKQLFANTKHSSASEQYKAIPKIIMLDGPMKGREWNLQAGVRMKIGRSVKQCDIIIPKAKNISRVHLIIWFDETKKQFFMKDCSQNGTYSIDGKRFTSNENNQLMSESIFYLSENLYKFKVELK